MIKKQGPNSYCPASLYESKFVRAEVIDVLCPSCQARANFFEGIETNVNYAVVCCNCGMRHVGLLGEFKENLLATREWLKEELRVAKAPLAKKGAIKRVDNIEKLISKLE